MHSEFLPLPDGALAEPDLRAPDHVVRHLREFLRVGRLAGERQLVAVLTDPSARPVVHSSVHAFPRELSDDSCDVMVWPFVQAIGEEAPLLLALVEHGAPTPALEVQRLRAAGERGCALRGKEFLGLWLVDDTGWRVRRVDPHPSTGDLFDLWQDARLTGGGGVPGRLPPLPSAPP